MGVDFSLVLQQQFQGVAWWPPTPIYFILSLRILYIFSFTHQPSFILNCVWFSKHVFVQGSLHLFQSSRRFILIAGLLHAQILTISPTSGACFGRCPSLQVAPWPSPKPAGKDQSSYLTRLWNSSTLLLQCSRNLVPSFLTLLAASIRLAGYSLYIHSQSFPIFQTTCHRRLPRCPWFSTCQAHVAKCQSSRS